MAAAMIAATRRSAMITQKQRPAAEEGGLHAASGVLDLVDVLVSTSTGVSPASLTRSSSERISAAAIASSRVG